MKKLKFTILPVELRGCSMREAVGSQNWIKLRKEVIVKKGLKCEICGLETDKVEIHEVYEVKDGIAVVKHLLCLCSECHACFHVGFNYLNRTEERLDDLINHYSKVNNISKEEATKDFNEVIDIIKEQQKSRKRLIFKIRQYDFDCGDYHSILDCKATLSSNLQYNLTEKDKMDLKERKDEWKKNNPVIEFIF